MMPGPSQKFPRPFAFRDGFTLLELCVVLFIIALLATTAMPAMNSAFTERALRNDGHELSLLVKTAMIQSAEQRRPYIISLAGKDLLLEPAPAQLKDDSAEKSAAPEDSSADPDVVETQTLDNALKFPDAVKKNTWNALPAVTWTFAPDALCPMPRVRLERGSAYIEMSFNALTGNVEDEAYDLP